MFRPLRGLEPCTPRVDTDQMAPGLELAVAILLPTAIGGAMVGTARLWRWTADHRRRSAPLRPVERLGADARRLRVQLERLENQPPGPGKALRVRAMRAAYVDALLDACQRLEVQAERPGMTDKAGIYRIEDALRHRGLDVRVIS